MKKQLKDRQKEILISSYSATGSTFPEKYSLKTAQGELELACTNKIPHVQLQLATRTVYIVTG